MTLLKHYSLLSKAVSDSPEPAPGYIFQQIAAITREGRSSCVELEDWLLKKLSKPSPYIRAKALAVIKHTCANGEPTFKIDLQRKNDAVKACLSFRGKPDPLKGDGPNQAVRDAAKEAMVAIFDVSEQSDRRALVGFGSDSAPGAYAGGGGGGGTTSSMSSAAIAEKERAYNATSGGSSYGGPRGPVDEGSNERKVSATGMVGFGNPNIQPKKASFIQRAAAKVAGAAGGSSGSGRTGSAGSRAAPPPSGQYGGSGGVGSGGGGGSYGAPSAPGGYSANSEDFFSKVSSSGLNVTPEPSRGGGAASAGGSFGKSAQPGPTGAHESRLIDEITAPAGVRAQPTAQQLQQFSSRAASLDVNVLVELAAAKLGTDGPWQRRLRALCVLEVLARTGGDDALDAIAEYRDQVEGLAQAAQSSIRDKVRAIMVLVDPDTYEEEEQQQQQQQQQQHSHSHGNAGDTDLLSLGSDTPAPAPAPAVGGGGGGADLFGGLAVKASPPVAAAPAPQANQGGGSSSGAASGFGFINSDAPAPAPAPAAATGGGNDALDIFGGGPAQSHAPQAPVANVDFDPVSSGSYQARDRSSSNTSGIAQQLTGGSGAMGQMTPQQMQQLQMQQMQMMAMQQQQQQMAMMGMMMPGQNMMMMPGMQPMGMGGGMGGMGGMGGGMGGMGGMGGGGMASPGGGGGGIGAVPSAPEGQGMAAQGTGFDFIGNNSSADSFDFVSDHMKQSATKK